MSRIILDPTDPTRAIVEHSTDRLIGAHNAEPAVLTNVHPATACAGQWCVIHTPSPHGMRTWPLVWRDDKGVMERQCPHGIGHPDPDDAAYLKRVGREAWTVHGCDGCCRNRGAALLAHHDPEGDS